MLHLSRHMCHAQVGHSERRVVFHTSDETINNNLLRALESGIKPILCIGESQEEYEANLNTQICAIQLSKGLKGVTKEQMKDVVIAYEPVWAIGTGLVIILGCVSVLVFVVRYMCISISIHPFILPYILTCMHECIFAHIDC